MLDGVDGPDVGVVQGGEQLGFALETSHALGVTGHHLGQHLDRHLPTELAVFGAIDLTHPPLAQLAGDLEMRQFRSDHLCLHVPNDSTVGRRVAWV